MSLRAINGYCAMKQLIEATQNQSSVPTSRPPVRTVLIVEDDGPLMQCLAHALEAL
jgi:hypothetical protein